MMVTRSNLTENLQNLWSHKLVRRVVGTLGCAAMLIPPLLISHNLQQGDPKLDAAVQAVDELQRIDANWSQDSLRLSSGLISDYDPLTNPLPRLAINELALNAVAMCPECQMGGEAQELPALLQRYRENMARKIDLFERIKSQQSILGNSLRFLPTACAELSDAAHALSSASGGQVDELLARLLVIGLDFQREPRPETRQLMEDKIRRLQMAAASWPSNLAVKVDAVLTHFKLVLEQRQLGDALLRQLLVVPTVADMNAMEDALRVRQKAFLKRQEFYKMAIFAYAALLLAALSTIGWLLARTYRRLNDSYASLREANKEAQLQLVQSAKMAAMGRMAAGLAHEINTPLAYVRATIAVLKEMLVDKEPTRESVTVKEVGELLVDGLYGIDQISELVLTLKNFTRLDQARTGEFSVEEGLESSLLLARYTIKHIAQVRKNYGNVPRISCSPAQINQVFLNIIVNAAHAMQCREGKGLLEIQTSEENGFVKVQIRDNGTGIPAHILPKIFDPFFTTKKIGEGSGTGLALAYRIVESHGGKIKVDTEETVGTTFTVLLPIESTAETQAALKAQPQSA